MYVLLYPGMGLSNTKGGEEVVVLLWALTAVPTFEVRRAMSAMQSQIRVPITASSPAS